jgi:hypothetical protein
MNRTRRSLWPSAAALIIGSLLATTAFAQTRCATPDLPGERMACLKAKESPDALRRFIDRTQSIYGLLFYDYISQADLNKRVAQRQPQAAPVAVEVAATTK